jgi:hypothetical protein
MYIHTVIPSFELMNKIFMWGGYKPTTRSPPWKAWDHFSSDAYPLILPAWVALPGACTPASITLRVTGVHKPPHHIKVLVHGAEQVNNFNFLGCHTSYLGEEYINHKTERFNYMFGPTKETIKIK